LINYIFLALLMKKLKIEKDEKIKKLKLKIKKNGNYRE
jgi:hypothetical protein